MKLTLLERDLSEPATVQADKDGTLKNDYTQLARTPERGLIRLAQAALQESSPVCLAQKG
jgi:hypothetical protein